MTPHQSNSPLSLFRKGYDTAEIARMLWCTEDMVYNEMHHERQVERGLEAKELAPAPRSRRHKLVPFVGKAGRS